MIFLFFAIANIANSWKSNVLLSPSRRYLSKYCRMIDDSPTGSATVLRCNGLSKAYTGFPQFEDISITLGKGQRVGLIGVNGAGKSTLLRCLAGIDKADSGTVELSATANVIYVDQDPNWVNITAYEALFSGNEPYAKAVRYYHEVMSAGEGVDNDKLTKAMELMEESNAWEYETRGVNIAEKLKLGDDKLSRDVSTLSGGERRRVCLAASLLKQPDILLLDEPTNHLDIDALEWLADFLRPLSGKDRRDMTILMVTHDRYFLERVCTESKRDRDRGVSITNYPRPSLFPCQWQMR